MTVQRKNWQIALLLSACCLFGALMLTELGCEKPNSQRAASAGSRQSRSDDSAFLVDTLARGLNHLPEEVVLELEPPMPILDDSRSSDGQPVLAILGKTPAVPDGPYNYLSVPNGNGYFARLGVKPGDIVRYFALVDQDSVEHGIEQIKYLELTVRRLDVENRENALIIEGGLNGAVDYPTRIEIWRFSDKRMNEIRRRITRYVQQPNVLVGWEPSPDESALLQLQERANQWLRNLNAEQETWQVEPLVAELPEEVKQSQSDLLAEAALEQGQFSQEEIRELQQTIWMRDIAKWAKKEAVSPLDVAKELFDWTVRNVQLESSNDVHYVYRPWQALMYGHGTAQQRAWVFADLCRQQHLDVVVLAVDGQFWLPALLHDGQLYLFDTRLGLPISGSQEGSIATLADVKKSPELLAALDVGDELKYGFSAKDLQQVTAWLVASPLQLSRRAQLLEQALEGDDFVVLSADTRRQAQALADSANIETVMLWEIPLMAAEAERQMSTNERLLAGQRFLVFASRPRLWKARVLHFQGTKDIPIEDRNDPLAQPDYGHREATALYQDPRIRPPNAMLKQIDATKRGIYEQAKGDAGYWLGLLSYDVGKFKVAQNWLEELTLKANPDGPWTDGARYNLARTYEALGDLPRAIELLESDDSPQRHGNLLRARQLQRQVDAEPSAE